MTGAMTQPQKSSADLVFDHLMDGILSLKFPPGSKISEAEIAATLNVSRQPVRDAFKRLATVNLLTVRPKKATQVQKLSLREIALARFTRQALELEVLYNAIQRWDGQFLPCLQRNLDNQRAAADKLDIDGFHRLDTEFHDLICCAGGTEFVRKVIAETKLQVSRLCVLSLTEEDELPALATEHQTLVNLIAARDYPGASDVLRSHLSRLDATVQSVYNSHSGYFDEA